jgi:hypothetical protein
VFDTETLANFEYKKIVFKCINGCINSRSSKVDNSRPNTKSNNLQCDF